MADRQSTVGTAVYWRGLIVIGVDSHGVGGLVIVLWAACASIRVS